MTVLTHSLTDSLIHILFNRNFATLSSHDTYTQINTLGLNLPKNNLNILHFLLGFMMVAVRCSILWAQLLSRSSCFGFESK